MITQVYGTGANLAKIRIKGKKIYYTNQHHNFNRYIPIESLFTVKGYLKEFPEWEGKPEEWILEEGLKKWKKHINRLRTETKIARYVEDQMMKTYGLMLMEEKDE